MNKTNSLRSFLIRWGPSILIMMIIFAFSSIPSAEMPDFGSTDLLIKKSGHACGYALLASALLWGTGSHSLKRLLLAWLLAILYAFTDEFHQIFVPGRHSSLVDVGIDAAGGLTGLVIYRLRVQFLDGLFTKF